MKLPQPILRGSAFQPMALADAFVHGLARDHGQPPKAAMTPERAAANGRLFNRYGPVAVIGVEGLLVPEEGWIGDEYVTGYADLEQQAEAALADGGVEAVGFWINSGGGYVEGLFEFCDWLNAARGNKPIVAFCQHAYSAAYAIASACDRITVAPMGGVGSIGAGCIHFEISGALEKWGIKPTIIRAPDGKMRGGVLETLDDRARAELQRGINETTGLFTALVERGREGLITAEDALALDAAVLRLPTGTAEALRLRLVDEVTTPGEALDALVAFLAG